MNNKGQVALYRIGLGLFVLVLFFVFINPLNTLSGEVKDSSHLNCSSTELSFGTESMCLLVDLVNPYFILFGIGIAFAIMLGKRSGIIE